MSPISRAITALKILPTPGRLRSRSRSALGASMVSSDCSQASICVLKVLCHIELLLDALPGPLRQLAQVLVEFLPGCIDPWPSTPRCSAAERRESGSSPAIATPPGSCADAPGSCADAASRAGPATSPAESIPAAAFHYATTSPNHAHPVRRFCAVPPSVVWPSTHALTAAGVRLFPSPPPASSSFRWFPRQSAIREAVLPKNLASARVYDLLASPSHTRRPRSSR